MSERADMILQLLRSSPRGLRTVVIQERTGLGEKPVVVTLRWLSSIKQAATVRVGQSAFWVAAEHMPKVLALAEQSKQKARRHSVAHNAKRRRERAGKPMPVREWVEEDAWVPPGPLIPSVWHLPQAMGLA